MSSISRVKLLEADALSLPFPNESINLIVTHPPFFAVDTVRYGGDKKKQINFTNSQAKFVKFMLKAIREMSRVLDPEGSIWVNVGAVHGVDYLIISEVLKKTNLKIAGTMTHSSYTASNSEFIESEKSFQWVQLVKTPHFYSNPFIVKRYNNPIWELPFSNEADPVDQELSKEFFVKDVVNKELPRRLIQMYSKPNGVVLDPFGGSGIVAVTAAELGRTGISTDVSTKQVEAARKRVELTL